MKKLNTKGFAHWILPVLVVLVIGAIGGYLYLRSSSASTTSLTHAQCKLLGRTFNTTSGTCNDTCASGAGTYITSAPVYNYCSHAVSTSVQGTSCTGRGRKLTVGGNGCARYWNQTDGGNYAGALQCSGNTLSGGSYYYHAVAGSGIDYCNTSAGQSSGSTGGSTGGGTTTGSSFIGADGLGSGNNCVDYIKYVLPRHTSSVASAGITAYRSGALGNGIDVADTLHSRYGYKENHTPAVHAVVSMSSSQSAGHVALVGAIHSDGSITVEEFNYYVSYGYGRHDISAAKAATLDYAHTEVGWH
jgi:hypothetical protein